MELTAPTASGVVSDDTSEELVLAAVDGELVNRALGRLSVRHRHVLAMREGSGWTYQQIADHEGVEIGTVETLLWRARQALKREFAVGVRVEGCAGRLPGRRGRPRPPDGVFRVGPPRRQRCSSPVPRADRDLRNAVAGVAVAGAAVAAAFVAPHALTGNDTRRGSCAGRRRAGRTACGPGAGIGRLTAPPPIGGRCRAGASAGGSPPPEMRARRTRRRGRPGGSGKRQVPPAASAERRRCARRLTGGSRCRRARRRGQPGRPAV